MFDSIVREANAQQVTIYTVDARGAGGASLVGAEFSNQSPGPAGNSVLAAARNFNLQETLIDLSESTGGRSILNTTNFDEAFDTMASDFDVFYSLGYSLPEGGDGAYHDIEVVVRHPDYKVRHRQGFLDKPEEDRVADRTLSSLMLDTIDNPLGIGLTFGRPERKGKKRDKLLLPILVRIPVKEVTFLPNGDVQQARLKIFLVVQDEQGRVSDLFTQPYPLEVQGAQLAAAKSQDLGYSAQLEVRQGTANIAVGVWDEISGSKSFFQDRVLVEAQ